MSLRLLLLSTLDFPAPLLKALDRRKFTCSHARGRLKIKELANQEEFDAVVWLFSPSDAAMAEELIQSLNEWIPKPIVLLTPDYEQPPTLARAPRIQASFDLDDEREEILKAIEAACRSARLSPPAPTKAVHEIQFKNLLDHVLRSGKDGDEPPKGNFQLEAPWLAVDAKEKKILTAEEEPKSRWGFLAKLIPKT